ncbi:MAG: hypothetical protein ABS944_12635 [Solibacillus sp.]|jgi:hypothetical protein|uniref:hypothetical protein n=1 Tax=Solibacillus sp. TaxID=1909654 RepID=UPI003314B061
MKNLLQRVPSYNSAFEIDLYSGEIEENFVAILFDKRNLEIVLFQSTNKNMPEQIAKFQFRSLEKANQWIHNIINCYNKLYSQTTSLSTSYHPHNENKSMLA